MRDLLLDVSQLDPSLGDIPTTVRLPSALGRGIGSTDHQRSYIAPITYDLMLSPPARCSLHAHLLFTFLIDVFVRLVTLQMFER